MIVRFHNNKGVYNLAIYRIMNNDISTVFSVSGTLTTTEYAGTCTIHCKKNSLQLVLNGYEIMIPIKKLHDLLLLHDSNGYYTVFRLDNEQFSFYSQSITDVQKLLHIVYLRGEFLYVHDVITTMCGPEVLFALSSEVDIEVT